MRALLRNPLLKPFNSCFNYKNLKPLHILQTASAMGNICVAAPDHANNFDLNKPFSRSSISKKPTYIPRDGNVKLLSYNIFVRPPGINNNGDDFKDERLAGFSKVLENYDVICLQEMFGSWSGRRENLIQKAEEAGLIFNSACPKPDTFSTYLIDGGLLVLSRYPVVASEFCTYENGIGADFYVQKGALYTKLRIGNTKLHLYSTHTQATYDGTPKFFLKRTEQFLSLQKFVKDTLARNKYREGDMVLLVGDFNVDSRRKQNFETKDMASEANLQQFSNLMNATSFSEYDALMSCLTNDNKDIVEDLLLNKYKEHPITFGDHYMNENNEKVPKASALTYKECLCSNESLDYIFRYVPKTSVDGTPPLKPLSKQKLFVVEESATVEKFLVQNPRFDQLSDHYGVKVTLQYGGDIETDREEAETLPSSPYLGAAAF